MHPFPRPATRRSQRHVQHVRIPSITGACRGNLFLTARHILGGRPTHRDPSTMAPVVVCGAGVIGASVSYFLAQKGLTPTVVDAVGPACSASGKAGGYRVMRGV